MAINTTALLAQLTGGDPIGASIGVWTGTMNLGYIVFAIPFLAILGIIYNKTEGVVIPTILSILFSFGFATWLPLEGKWIAGLFAALSLTGMLYGFFHKK